MLNSDNVTAWRNNKWTSIHESLHSLCRQAMRIVELFTFVKTVDMGLSYYLLTSDTRLVVVLW